MPLPINLNSAGEAVAWTKMAKRYISVRRGGTNGPLTGSQLFNKLNCTPDGLGQANMEQAGHESNQATFRFVVPTTTQPLALPSP